MKENNINQKKIYIFSSTEINELYSKTNIKETYKTQEKSSHIKILFFIYKNSILKNFKITLGKEAFISNELNNIKITENINNNNNYSIEFDNNKDYYFTINLGLVEKNTTIEISALYLSLLQNEGNKYIANLFKRYPILYCKEENQDFNLIHIDNIEGEIILKAHNKIESFNINIINFNEDINNKEKYEENNNIMNEKIVLNTLNKQYISTKHLYLKYQLKGIENIREYKIYQFLNDYIPIIRLSFIISSLLTKRNLIISKENNIQKIILFNQKLNQKDNKSMNILHYKYLFNKNNNNEKCIYPNKYLFVVDESFHMSGEKIAKIRGALKLILFSLNSNCEYQIIGFNETVKMYDGTFKYAVKSNIIKSLEYISNIYVENKNCHLYQIIKLIYYLCNKNKNIPINIFLFTNAICDKIEINKALNLICENSLEKNFHLNIFSLGEKYNKYFVVSGSIAGNGKYYLINKLNQLNKEVINELSNCYKEYYSNINAEIPKSFVIKKYKCNISQINVFDNNPLNLFYISKKIELDENINIKIYYKKYLKGKFLLQNTTFKEIEINYLEPGVELYLLYLYKMFFANQIPIQSELKNIEKNSDSNSRCKNLFGFSKFLKEQSIKYDINFENLQDIFYHEKDNIKIPIKNNFYNNINEEDNIEFYIGQNNENKDYYDIFPLTEKKFHDFLLVDEIQNYSESLETVEIDKNNKNKKTQRKKSYGKIVIGGIFKGVGKVGNSIVVLGKNIGKTASNKKVNECKNDEIRDIKSQNINIKLTPNIDEEELENNKIDNCLGNKYGYSKKDEYIMNAVFSQDLEGFWDINNKKLTKIKEKYKEIINKFDNYFKKLNQNIDLQKIANNLKMTFIMIVFILKECKEKEKEFCFIVDKGKNYIIKNGYEFYSLSKEIELIFD